MRQHHIALEGLQHPAYLANWLGVLKADKRAIFTASSKSKAAAQFLLNDKDDDEQVALAA